MYAKAISFFQLNTFTSGRDLRKNVEFDWWSRWKNFVFSSSTWLMDYDKKILLIISWNGQSWRDMKCTFIKWANMKCTFMKCNFMKCLPCPCTKCPFYQMSNKEMSYKEMSWQKWSIIKCTVINGPKWMNVITVVILVVHVKYSEIKVSWQNIKYELSFNEK